MSFWKSKESFFTVKNRQNRFKRLCRCNSLNYGPRALKIGLFDRKFSTATAELPTEPAQFYRRFHRGAISPMGSNYLRLGSPGSGQTSLYSVLHRATFKTYSIMENKVEFDREKIWKPMNLIDRPRCHQHAVVVLNTSIQLEKNILLPLWEEARVTVTVDGGTNRWLEYLGELSKEECGGNSYIPQIITGDMDSILPETREKLQNAGSRVIVTPDQNLTDYTKALIELARHCESQNIKLNEIYVLVDSSGRLDHVIGNLNTLYKTPVFFVDTKVINVASDSLTWLLNAGNHKIIIPEPLVRTKSWCGLLPISGKTDKIWSSGLKWNLHNVSMEFGGLVSTSNTYEDGCTEVTIVLNDRIIWTMGMTPLFNQNDIS